MSAYASNKYLREVEQLIDPLGFKAVGFRGKRLVFTHPEFGDIGFHQTPQNPSEQLKIDIAVAKRAMRLSVTTGFIRWLRKKHSVPKDGSKRVRLELVREAEAYLNETGTVAKPHTIQTWAARASTVEIKKVDSRSPALWEIRGERWGITDEPSDEVKPNAPPPPISDAPPPPPPAAAPVEPEAPRDIQRTDGRALAPQMSIADKERVLLAAGWQKVGVQWRHLDYPILGKLWLADAFIAHQDAERTGGTLSDQRQRDLREGSSAPPKPAAAPTAETAEERAARWIKEPAKAPTITAAAPADEARASVALDGETQSFPPEPVEIDVPVTRRPPLTGADGKLIRAAVYDRVEELREQHPDLMPTELYRRVADIAGAADTAVKQAYNTERRARIGTGVRLAPTEPDFVEPPPLEGTPTFEVEVETTLPAPAVAALTQGEAEAIVARVDEVKADLESDRMARALPLLEQLTDILSADVRAERDAALELVAQKDAALREALSSVSTAQVALELAEAALRAQMPNGGKV